MIIKAAYKDWTREQLQKLAQLDIMRTKRLGYRPDYAFYDHSHRVADNMRDLALKMDKGTEVAESLYLATLIHDIGKAHDDFDVEIWDYDAVDATGQPLKPPESLKKQRRKHTILGVEMVKAAFPHEWNSDPFLIMTCDLMIHHHEYLDGSGYLGKRSEDLSDEVRMLCICDSFDGWTIPRAHKTADQLTPHNVLNNKMRDGRFDLTILKYFKEIMECQ